MDGKNRKVWSSEGGRVADEPTAGPLRPSGRGPIRITSETKGRRGKTVTVISGLGLGQDALSALATELKKLCGVGGSAKEGVITIQGDKKDAVATALAARGFSVPRST